MNDAGNDARFCREHAFAGNPLYRVTSILAPQKRRRLTALHALFDLLQRSGRLAQEEGAARAQLAWWREECLAADPRHSHHPALRELHHGGGGRLDRGAFADLVEQIELRLEQPAIPDVKTLRDFCVAQGRPYLALETALWQDEATETGPEGTLAARRGFWSLLTDCFRTGESPVAWWAPLDLLAREGLQRSQVFEPDRAAQTARVLAAIFSAEGFVFAGTDDISVIKQEHEHIHLMDFLIGRKQLRLSSATPTDFARELARVRPREFLAAWSLARRFSRRR